MKLWVSEIFHSIQGEGPYIGQPATFVRTAYCNLRCTWCDAWYTWDHKRVDVKATSKHMDVDEVVEAVGKPSLLIITGGEPLLQQDAIAELMNKTSVLTQFETNGTVVPGPGIENKMPTYVVSPKLRNSCETETRRQRGKALTWFRYHGAYFKFVLSHPRDISEV